MKFAEMIQSADWKTEKHVPVIEAPASARPVKRLRFKFQSVRRLPIPIPQNTIFAG